MSQLTVKQRRAARRASQRRAVQEARINAEADRDRLADWIEQHVAGARVDRELAGAWSVVVDG